MVTVRKSKLLLTSSTIQPNTYYYEFDVDTISELPDPYYNSTIVAHGSKATVINSGEIYRINGDGEWKSQSTSGGTSLPDVTAEDNGDVLTVVNGAWDKAEPAKELPTVTSADNGDVLTVVNGAWAKNALPDNKNVVIFECDKPWSGANAGYLTFKNNVKSTEIISAIENGKIPIIKINLLNSSQEIIGYQMVTVSASQVNEINKNVSVSYMVNNTTGVLIRIFTLGSSSSQTPQGTKYAFTADT